MYLDKLLTVSNAQAITSGQILSTDVIDLSVNRDIGEGRDLYVACAFNPLLVGGNAITIDVIVSDTADMASPVLAGSSGVKATAEVGTMQYVRINPLTGSLGKRYMAVRYTCSGTFTAGAVTASIVLDIQDGMKRYPSGYTVL